jgi:23S rRNA (adenine-N6)-dimethyltransferase
LIAQAPISPSDLVVEIGPGLGILTSELARRCHRVIAVEVDRRLSGELRLQFSGDPHVSIVTADFLRFDLPGRPGYKVVGSIPYSRTAAIVRRLVEAAPPPEDAFLVVQKEAADRFAGNPFAPESLASLLLKPWWQVEIARELSRYDFDPPPRVDSVVLWLARRSRPLIEAREARAYAEFVKACFGRTGVTVGRCLRSVLSRRQIQRLERLLGFESSSAPSSLSFEQWLGLFRFHKWMRREAKD